MTRSSIGRAARRPRLLVVGAATRDIARDDRRGWRLGGGVTYGALAAARLGLAVDALVGVDQEAAAAPEWNVLRAAGVRVQHVELRRGPVMENRETPRGRVQLVEQGSDRLRAEALPGAWAAPDGVLLASVADELGPAWANAFARDIPVGLAWQGLLRRLVAGHPMIVRPMRPGRLLARADLLLVGADDISAGGPPIAELLRRDGQQLVVSHGAHGALHARRRGGRLTWRSVPVFRPPRVADPTGAGDVFLAAWLSAVVAARSGSGRAVARRADRPQSRGGPTAWPPLAVAAAAAALSVAADRLDGLGDLQAVCRLLHERGD